MKKLTAVFIIVLLLFSGCNLFGDKDEKTDRNNNTVNTAADTSVILKESPSQKKNEKAEPGKVSMNVVSSVKVPDEAPQEERSDKIGRPFDAAAERDALTPAEDISKRDEGETVLTKTHEAAEKEIPVLEEPHETVNENKELLTAEMEDKTALESYSEQSEKPLETPVAGIDAPLHEEAAEENLNGQLAEGNEKNAESAVEKDRIQENGEIPVEETEPAEELVQRSEPVSSSDEGVDKNDASYSIEDKSVNGAFPEEAAAPVIDSSATIQENPSETVQNTEALQTPEEISETADAISDKGAVYEKEMLVEDETETDVEPPPAVPEGKADVEEMDTTDPVVSEAANKPDILPAAAVKKAQMGGEARIALLPLENLTDEMDALKHVMPVLKYHLENKGMEVVSGSELESFICKERIRSNGLVTQELAMKLKEKFNVNSILTGSIISFTSDDHPKFGILVRLIDASRGTILWADYASATGDDYTTILGLGRIKNIYSLVPKVMDMLFASFSTGILHKETGASRKVVVMPFQNNSDFKNAGKIVMYMFLVELLKNNQYEPIEYGNTREQIVKLRIRSRGELDYEKIKSLSELLGAEGILLGVIDSYTNGTESSASPKVTITARLIESGKNRIVWYNSHQLSGEDDVIALDWGRVRSVHRVAHNAVVHLVQQMGMTTWH